MSKLTVGDKIKFQREKQKYTVQACDARYVVCTKPFNARKTVLYTIIDFVRNERGPENLVFGFGAETPKQCKEMLKRLQKGESEVTYRNCVALDIERIYD